MDEKTKKIAQDIAVLRRSGEVQRLAVSHIDGMAAALSRTLPPDYTRADLEAAIGVEISLYPFLGEESEGSPQDLAQKAAERAANPTTADYRKMKNPEQRLEAINRVKLREMEEAASRDAKAVGLDKEALRTASAAERLTMANDLKKRAEPKTQKPVTKEMLARMSAAEKLSHANEMKSADE